LIANVNRDAKKHPKPYTVQDFMMNFDNESEDQEGSVRRHKPKQKNWQDLKAIAKMIVSQRKPRTVRKSELDLEVD
jgi:hypothetical protein